MTLIAAFRCEASGEPGVVICADSQESYGAYKVTVDKLKKRDAGNYDLIIGGSGNTAALIDGQANFIESLISKWPAGVTEEQGRESLEEIVIGYHDKRVSLYPADLADKVLMFLVCVREKASGAVYLWKTEGTTAQVVSDYELIGWDEPLYKHEVQRLYATGLNHSQATIIGLQLLTIGDATSHYISDPFQVITVSRRRVLAEHPDNIRLLERKVKSFNEMLSKLIVATPDVSIPEERFKNALKLFQEEVQGLRDEAKRHYVLRTEKGLFQVFSSMETHPPLVLTEAANKGKKGKKAGGSQESEEEKSSEAD